MRLAVFCLLASAALTPLSRAQAPVFVITPEKSTIKFYVKSSVEPAANFRVYSGAEEGFDSFSAFPRWRS